MTDRIDETIEAIANKHGVAVGRDDPILILETLNERLLESSAATQQALLEQFRAELDEIALRWGQDAKDKAERVLNAALRASKELMHEGMQESIKKATEHATRYMDDAQQHLSATTKAAHRIALLNVIAAVVTTAAAIVIVAASL